MSISPRHLPCRPSAAVFVPLFASCLPLLSLADVKLPAIFSDRLVLQKSPNVPVWGTAEPGESVAIRVAGAETATKAGEDGKWKVSLNLAKGTTGPHEMTVEGKNKIVISDVVIGEVWLCSGQSNMEWALKSSNNSEEEIAASTNPMLRQFLVKKTPSITPTEELEGAWVKAEPASAGSFTAVGYYFGKTLTKELQQPVGLVHSSWGGTPVEAWTSAKAIDSNPDLKASKEKNLTAYATFPEKKKEFVEVFGTWLKANNREDQPTSDVTQFLATPDGWTPVRLPGKVPPSAAEKSADQAETRPTPVFNGVVWVKREVDVPEEVANKETRFEFELKEGYETVYWNGEEIAKQTYITANAIRRSANIPASRVKPGKSVLAVRIYAPATPPEFTGATRVLNREISGEWLMKVEKTFPELEAAALADAPKPPPDRPRLQNVATCLYNGMIHPLLPFAIRGAIWYQGESNAGRAFQYRTAFPLMITDWRTHWGQGNFPFYFCQLANYQAKKEQPAESAWAELREAQAMTLSLPNTGMAVLIDVGETKDIHPRDKKTVGERLAAIALAKDYGRKVPFAGPTFDFKEISGDKVTIHLKNTEGGLVAKPLPQEELYKSFPRETAPLVLPRPGSELQGFAICGVDKVWKWADAKIEGDKVVVWSEEVTTPVAVRYAWSDNPTCNLYNGAGFPAGPFRTDDFPGSTVSNK